MNNYVPKTYHGKKNTHTHTYTNCKCTNVVVCAIFTYFVNIVEKKEFSIHTHIYIYLKRVANTHTDNFLIIMNFSKPIGDQKYSWKKLKWGEMKLFSSSGNWYDLWSLSDYWYYSHGIVILLTANWCVKECVRWVCVYVYVYVCVSFSRVCVILNRCSFWVNKWREEIFFLPLSFSYQAKKIRRLRRILFNNMILIIITVNLIKNNFLTP